MGKNNESIWITWENQRRTNELAAALGVPLYKYLSSQRYLIRVWLLSLRTSLKLLLTRPKRVIVQNPSIVLATVACFMKPLLGYTLVVDRHSNFRLERAHLPSLKEKVFQLLSRYTIRRADLTIVTNEFLKNVLESWGGRGFVLQDKLPNLALAERIELAGRANVVFVCSYSGDEPVTEVIEAARLISPSIVIYITGNSGKLPKQIRDAAPSNAIFTGFLDEKNYQSLLYSADVVMVLTSAEHFLLCGAYEAVALGRALIVSRTNDLMDYFHKGVTFTENNAPDIAKAIEHAIDDRRRLESETIDLARELSDTWRTRFTLLTQMIESL
ncbi:MAG: glycosyltransferase [Candidatus Abyssobacteria bacterium SURF_17]|uniref:Glycosyltransferase n=1 Tax=Candidatus Abyssobacteria bacterium SURF_17 TaxID=2093361 RepID=A0A419F1Z0_9BACT|nr:MAG: glycosyltransferase [Candidatus Abyssubacteria bacterium SURF_17]